MSRLTLKGVNRGRGEMENVQDESADREMTRVPAYRRPVVLLTLLHPQDLFGKIQKRNRKYLHLSNVTFSAPHGGH